MKTAIRIICSTVLLSAFSFLAAAEDFTNAIYAYLQQRVETGGIDGCIVVGIVDEQGSQVVGCGKLDNGTDQEANGDTVFDIHSTSCVFTRLLLQDMVARGEMKLDDPVAKYLPKSVTMPTHNGREITLLHLAAETSGIGRSVSNLDPKRADNPFAEYTVEKMYAFLSGCQLTNDPGAMHQHGGIGMGLLGHAMALKTGTTYESLVVERICRPLKMDSTRVRLTPELKSRLAAEHNQLGYTKSSLDWGVVMAPWGLHSTANDLLKFISAFDLKPFRLTPFMEKSVVDIGQSAADAERTLTAPQKRQIVYFGGGGFGGSSLVCFDKARRRGVVVLSTSDNGNDLVNFLLESEWRSDRRPRETNINNQIYSSYAGQYRATPGATPHKLRFWPFSRHEDDTMSQPGIGIRREGDRLFAQVIGSRTWPMDVILPHGTGELLPQSETNFFERLSSRPVVFSKNTQGKVTGLTMDYQGKVFSYGKTTDAPPKAPEPLKPRVAIKLQPKVLDACVGRYQFPPSTLAPDGITVKIWREGDHLGAQRWDKKGTSGAFEIYPESETNFFLKLDGSQDRFIKNEKGEVTAVIHHLEGHPDVEGRKLKTE